MNAEQMRDGEGPFYEHWARQRYMASLRRVVALGRKGGSVATVNPEKG